MEPGFEGFHSRVETAGVEEEGRSHHVRSEYERGLTQCTAALGKGAVKAQVHHCGLLRDGCRETDPLQSLI